MPLLPVPASAVAQLERVLLVALLLPPLLIVVLATVPALVVLPFRSDGGRRTVELLRTHTAAAASLLRGSGA